MSNFFYHLCVVTGILGIMTAMVTVFTSSDWMLALAAGFAAICFASAPVYRYLERQEKEYNGQE